MSTAVPDRLLYRLAACALVSSVCIACAPEIGDECETDLDCSAQGSRPCDRTQPGGYCTILGCEEGTCPEEAECVKFRPLVERLAITFCMLRCDSDGDCRTSDGYRCLAAADFGAFCDAELLGDPDARFCALPTSRDTSIDTGDAAVVECPTLSVPGVLPDGGLGVLSDGGIVSLPDGGIR